MALQRPSLVLIVALGAAFAIGRPLPAPAQDSGRDTAANGTVDFNRDIRPIFVARCLACHGPDKREAGLRLDRSVDALSGGDSGPSIVPGDSAASRLVAYVTGENDAGVLMPLDGERLTSQEIDLLRSWIDQGADWPADADDELAGGVSNHWAYLPYARPAVPVVRDLSWVRNPIDAFVLAKLEAMGIAPAAEGDRATLIRRLSLDLVGLPPSTEAVKAFEEDASPDAYERLVDRLLAEPAHGERWARHWLDLARYADSNGYDNDEPRPFAWLYRDWVIQAINSDMPFDQFSVEQLAGDLLAGATMDQRVATGFHRNTPLNTESGVDPEEFRTRTVVDRVNTTGSVWLAMTVGCAQCHTHKYDPLTQREYYGLFAFFNSADEAEIEVAPEVKAPVVAERESPRETRLLVRGDFLNPAAVVTHGTPAALVSFTARRDVPDRLDLARWLIAPRHPLTARVAVNRVWARLFGRGIVATLDDFGTQGERPTHLELLDWLAWEFESGGWCQKDLIRLIVTSATYRQRSAERGELATIDPDNLWIGRQNRFRLEGETIRDSALVACGLLERRWGGPSIQLPLPADEAKVVNWQPAEPPLRYRRGLYVFSQRTVPYPMLAAFDAPDSHLTCARRERSNTPLQALTLLNDPCFVECAQMLARRTLSDAPRSDRERLRDVVRRCLARGPSPAELERLERLLVEQRALYQGNDASTAAAGPQPLPSGADAAEVAAWTGVARALLNLDEFVTRE